IFTMTTAQPGPLLALPADSLSLAVLDFVRGSVSAPIVNHSIRAFLWAELLVDHWDVRRSDDYDRETLFFATILHDVGLGSAGDERPDRFEVTGADIAARFLEENGVARTTVDSVWEAIALHTSIGIASRRALLCRLTAAGTALDFGDGSDFVTDEVGASIHADYPRLDTGSTLFRTIVTQARNTPSKAPLASLARYLMVTETAGIDAKIPARWGD
ncbi:MAG: HD domain-containing protein, partial [Kibdelosporangium sp.]